MFEHRKKSNQVYFIITGPVLSAIHMLELGKTDAGLNLAAVERNHDWAWSTYNYLGEHLIKKHRKSVEKLLTHLNELVNNYDWGEVEARAKRYDGWWSESMRYHNKHMRS